MKFLPVVPSVFRVSILVLRKCFWRPPLPRGPTVPRRLMKARVIRWVTVLLVLPFSVPFSIRFQTLRRYGPGVMSPFRRQVIGKVTGLELKRTSPSIFLLN